MPEPYTTPEGMAQGVLETFCDAADAPTLCGVCMRRLKREVYGYDKPFPAGKPDAYLVNAIREDRGPRVLPRFRWVGPCCFDWAAWRERAALAVAS